MPKYIYHVCAFFNYPDGEKVYWDGIASLDNEIISFDDYSKLKDMVVTSMDGPTLTNDKLIISNLSLLKILNSEQEVVNRIPVKNELTYAAKRQDDFKEQKWKRFYYVV